MYEKKRETDNRVGFLQTLRALKLIFSLITVSPLIGNAAIIDSKEPYLSIHVENETLGKIFDLIENNSGYIFFYYDQDVDRDLKVSCKATNQTVDKILDCLLANTDKTYVIRGRQIFIVKDDPDMSGMTNNQQKRTISGTVYNAEDNEPVIGANIWLKGTSTGAVTNINGEYSITIDGVGGILVFSFIGLATQEIVVSDQKIINVTLHPNIEEIEEVVAVGYGQQKKASVVGAITTIAVDNLKIPGTSNLSTLLAGQLSGIVAVTRSGEPGRSGAADFYIRGVSTFKGSASPLVLVDGIERDLDLVDTEDIASFSILKDASASAVYGVRGANGVILITTKKGTEGKPRINLRSEAGITSPTIMPEFINSEQWAQYYNEASGTQYYSESDIQKYRDGSDPDLYPDVNWIDALYRDFAANQRVNINVTGGSQIVKYYVSGSLYNESSIFKTAGDRYDYNSSINYRKYNFRSNLDCNITGSTVLNVNLATIYEKYFGPGRDKGDIWTYTFLTSPNAFPVEYSDGTISAPSSDSGYNPWNLLVHSGYREQFWNSAQSVIGITQDVGKIWNPFEGLSANIKFSWDAFNTALQVRSKEPTQYHATARDDDGNLIFGNPVRTGSETLNYEISQSGTMTTYLEASLTYNRLFAEKHRVGALLLYNHKIHTNTLSTDKYLSLPYKNQGLAGRVTYAFKDTYLGEFNMGYNGSENFAPGHRFGFFPAVALGWMISNEPWFESMTKVINSLKLKASHGIVGNDEIGGSRRWIYEPTIVSSDAWNYGSSGNNGGTGIRVGDVENLDVSWEEAKKTNIGIEMSLFKAIRIQADYFSEERTGIFLQRSGLPQLTGLSTLPYVNIGETQNRGFDGNLEYSQQIGNAYVTARTNFTYNKNKLINNDQPDTQYKYQNTRGKPFGSGGSTQPFGLVALGLFESEDEINSSPVQNYGEYRKGDIKYQDINGDGTIDSYDRIALGYTNLPEITYGFGATVQWNNWDINVLFQGISHISFFISGSSIFPFSSGNMERATINNDLWEKTWLTTNSDEQNSQAIYPRMSLGGAAGSINNSQNSTWNMRNGSLMRLKNFELGYTMPKSMTDKSFINSFRFYLSGNNLLTFSEFKLWDPEKGGGDGSGYPPSRVITIGINASF